MHAYYILKKKLLPYNFQIKKYQQLSKEWRRTALLKLQRV